MSPDHAESSDIAAGSEQTATPDAPAAAPFLRVVRGNPSDEEVAALVSVIAAAASSTAPEPPKPPRDLWGSAESRLRNGDGLSPNVFLNAGYGRGF
ncbi:acyl-CoA carboxylase subunit epsilon [Williamsia sterculiae]|uniref:Acyl-CoA carboxylase epsilon subunit n=1 Tax=Williamsia sterculiae TaxID=1344003 RepID=A0A1N7E047_9NOCA|nr:acyl-CoA carboxylase subunit epsilon [Williamsia sterculiae]SIR81325.1 Acyl-CoA carboxylase epsilon subunit [Williamsia sterculiae]